MAYILHTHTACIFFFSLPEDYSWRVMIGFQLPPCIVVLCVLFSVLPESPRWLISKGREQEAREILSRTVSDEEIEEIVSTFTATLGCEQEQGHRQSLCTACSPCTASSTSTRRALLLGFAIATFQQANGSEAAVYYGVYFGRRIVSLLNSHHS